MDKEYSRDSENIFSNSNIIGDDIVNKINHNEVHNMRPSPQRAAKPRDYDEESMIQPPEL